MGIDLVCYYLAPAGIGAFGLLMAVFLHRSMKHEPSRIEGELEKLKINAKTKSKKMGKLI